MSDKLMTNNQGISLAQMGRAKKVPASKIQERLADFAKLLDAIRDGRPINIGGFRCNEHGHVLLTVTGLDLSGAKEVVRLTEKGFRVSDYAKSCFQSEADDGYDKNHRLVEGKQYTIALMPTAEIKDDASRTTDALRRRGIEKYGYGKSLAGLIPRLREAITDKQMEEMGFLYIAAPHDPIKDSDGAPFVLRANRCDDGQWVSAGWDRPGARWRDDGAFAFPVSASS